MERKEFLRGIGLAGAATLIPFSKILAGDDKQESKPTACTIIPTETQGPFPLDLTTNTYYFRSDVREDRTGTEFKLKMKILGSVNCEPMQNVRVNIWMCDKDGIYSGYAGGMNQGGSADTKWLRGYQITDANGEVDFTSIFPGWYSGRICHIHFQIYVSSSYAAISQMTFDIPTKNGIYATNPLYTKGADPMTLSGDNIFSDGYTYQMCTLTANSDGSWNGYMEVTVQGTGSGGTAIGHVEKENAKQFHLGQNYPNPHRGVTTVPFSLVNTSKVTFDVFDVQGRKVSTLEQGTLSAGDHTVVLNLSSMGISRGNYVYQIQVENSEGVFRLCKMMTAAK